MKKLIPFCLALVSVYGNAATLDVSGWYQRNASNKPINVTITGVAAGELFFATSTPGTFQSRVIATGDLPSGIPLANLATITQSTILGRHTASTGIPEEITISGDFSVLGGALSLTNDYQLSDSRLDEVVTGTLSFQPEFDAGYVMNGPSVTPLPLMVGTDMDLEKYGETYNVSADTALTILGSPAEGQTYTLRLVTSAGGPFTTGLPTATDVNADPPTSIGSIVTPANAITYLVYRWTGAAWDILNYPSTTTGSGSFVLDISPTVTTPTIIGAIGFADGVIQTFNPNATNAGLDVGSIAGDPSVGKNGTIWYDSTANELTARINGVNVALGAGGGGGGLTSTDIDTSAELRAILTDETGTGAAVFAGSPTFTGTVTMDILDVTNIFADTFELNDTDASHQLNIVAGSNLTADRTFTLTTGDAARTLTLSGNPTLGDWFDQAVKTTSSPTFTNVTVDAEAYDATGWNGDNTVATKNDIRDKIETLGSGTAVNIASSRQNVFLWDEFIGVSGSSPFGALGLFREVTGGTVGSGLPTGTTSASGVMNMYTSTGTTNKVGVMANASAFSIMFGGGTYVWETLVNIESLPVTTTNEYVGRLGFLDAISSQPIDGCYFQYSAASANWFAVCRANNVETASVVDTTVAVTNNTWIKLRIEVNAAASQVLFYIDGTLVRTETANIPSGASRSTSVGAGFIKSTGSVDNDFFFDYMGLEIGLTAAR